MKILIGLVVIVIVGLLVYALRADYRAFDAQREAWHRRCDAYVNVQPTAANAAALQACQQELAEMMAYAKRKGW